MVAQSLLNVVSYVGGLDWTSQCFGVDTPDNVPANEGTTFANGGYDVVIPGIASNEIGLEVFADFAAGAIDSTFRTANIGTTYPITVGATGGTTAGDLALIRNSMWKGYTPLKGTIGEAAKASANFAGNSPAIEGVFLHPLATRTITSTGTIVAKAGPTAAQSIYANLHVLTVAGSASPSLAVKIQSATLVGFGSPTDRLTFTTATAQSAEHKSAALGAVTDGFWRISYTITGTTPQFAFVVSFGTY